MAKKKGSKGTSVPANESKADKFKRLAQPRVTKALKALNQVQRLAGNGYESNSEQQKQIVEALTGKVGAIREAFAGKKEAAATFVLK